MDLYMLLIYALGDSISTKNKMETCTFTGEKDEPTEHKKWVSLQKQEQELIN